MFPKGRIHRSWGQGVGVGVTLPTITPCDSLGKVVLPVSKTLGTEDLNIQVPREDKLSPGDPSCHFVILCSLMAREHHGSGN